MVPTSPGSEMNSRTVLPAGNRVEVRTLLITMEQLSNNWFRNLNSLFKPFSTVISLFGLYAALKENSKTLNKQISILLKYHSCCVKKNSYWNNNEGMMVESKEDNGNWDFEELFSVSVQKNRKTTGMELWPERVKEHARLFSNLPTQLWLLLANL